jgi:hypothetical protein
LTDHRAGHNNNGRNFAAADLPCRGDEYVPPTQGSEPEVVSEHLERETKFDATADVLLPDLDRQVGHGGRVERSGVRLDSVYFDTESHDLLARGITLRCRTGNADEGWQLKVAHR